MTQTLLAPARPLVRPAPRVSLSRTHYLVRADFTLHRVRRDGVCDCGGTPSAPCAAIPLVQAYLARGGAKPLGRHPDTWPESWTQVPALCPVCACPTCTDRHLDSRAGPGWQCTLSGCSHFWQVRMEPLRRYCQAHPPQPRYPWQGTTRQEQEAWLKAHALPVAR